MARSPTTSDAFNAVAEPRRRQILDLLIQGERPVNDMVAALGPGGEMPDGKPYPMVIEPWPGGRWYRDLGDNAGHLWGHVQVIKPPTLLELCGPMFMSFPAANHVQYRLTAEGNGTRLNFTPGRWARSPTRSAPTWEGMEHTRSEANRQIASRLKAEGSKGSPT